MHIGLSELGGIVGLIGGLLVFYDRYYKGRPVASLTVRVENDVGPKLVCVRIKNTTPYDVAILGAKDRQGIYNLSEVGPAQARVEGTTGLKFVQMLKPDQSLELFILPRFESGVPVEVMKRYVEFVIYWRRGNATWMPQVPLLVCSTTYVIRMLGGVA